MWFLLLPVGISADACGPFADVVVVVIVDKTRLLAVLGIDRLFSIFSIDRDTALVGDKTGSGWQLLHPTWYAQCCWSLYGRQSPKLTWRQPIYV